GNFDTNFSTIYTLHNNKNGVYVFLIKGSVSINNIELNERDGLGVSATETLNIKALSDADILLIEVPMK
ncbi:MAG: pirin family protein, partial [Chitinophagaceae bacterium]|nr:pirin family protein [Chitinophagaceae bacterium]